ncbi:MAG: hypothetical protein ACP5VE_10145 [Chthonomonadales bacterium]
MAKLLLICPDGRKRVQVEVAASLAGHRVYSAGDLAEGLRLAEVYVPNAVILSPLLDADEARAFVETLRNHRRASLRRAIVVTPHSLCAHDDRTVRSNGRSPRKLFEALQRELAAAGVEEVPNGSGGSVP